MRIPFLPQFIPTASFPLQLLIVLELLTLVSSSYKGYATRSGEWGERRDVVREAASESRESDRPGSGSWLLLINDPKVVKLRCYQCNQPYDCENGICYGDICVKSSVSNGNYVSKGCENITHAASIYEPHAKLKSYCKSEEVLGLDTVICYCRDGDFCNASCLTLNLPFLSTFIVIFLIFTQMIG